jgi:RNA polymerase sigma-70 factor (ECF subfamily)
MGSSEGVLYAGPSACAGAAPRGAGEVLMTAEPLERDTQVDDAALTALRDKMLRFALLQLRDAAAAEDVVQEALAAALDGRQQFAGRAKLKTWVFAILRNKIADLLRERIRHPTQSLDEPADSGQEFDELFDQRGHWRKEYSPVTWQHPETELENDQFIRIFDACMNYLPENTARVFMMRELLGLDTDEICQELAISESNCWVILHRARMRLRACLETNWFNEEKPE